MFIFLDFPSEGPCYNEVKRGEIMKGKVAGLFLFFSLIIFVLLSPIAGWASQEEKLLVAASILPQRYFIERIADQKVQIEIMVPPGANPATYEPKPSQLVSLSRASLYFAIGVPFEKAYLGRFSQINKNMVVVDTSEGISKIPISSIHDLTNRENGKSHGHEHSQGELDPHIWLSPRLVKIQAQNIQRALSSADPQNTKSYQRNLNRFLKELDELDEEIRGKLSETKGKKFMVFHPSWGYFARDYGLDMIPIEVEGSEPSAAELAKIISIAKKEKIRIIIAQPEFPSRSAKVIAQEVGCRVVPISPLAPNWRENLLLLADTLAEALKDNSREETKP